MTNYSPTFIGREIFARLWSMGLLGAIAEAENINYPFDKQLYNYIDSVNNAFTSLIDSISLFAGLDDNFSELAITEAPWAGLSYSTNNFNMDRLLSELILIYLSEEIANEILNTPKPIILIHKGARVQLLEIFDYTIQGCFCFNKSRRNKNNFITEIKNLFTKIDQFIGRANPWNAETLGVKVCKLWIQKYDVGTAEEADIVDLQYWEWILSLIPLIKTYVDSRNGVRP